MPHKLPVTLSIAGSDSGGGAGIQADLKTFHAFETFGATALTAITAQNTLGVSGVHPVPSAMVRDQIRAVAEDLRPAAFKTGMLATAELVRAVAEEVANQKLPNFVLDPVMVASSGDRLLDRDAEATIRDVLLPLAAVVTPNLDEASLLLGEEIRTEAGMRRAAEAFVHQGAQAALVKGGHLEAEEVVDILFDGEEWHAWRRPRLSTRHTHGTGCTLSAAIAAGLAHGRPLVRTVEESLAYVYRAMQTAPALGSGHGPLNHFATRLAPSAD